MTRNIIFSNDLRDAKNIASHYETIGYEAKVVVSDNHNFKQFMFTIIITK